MKTRLFWIAAALCLVGVFIIAAQQRRQAQSSSNFKNIRVLKGMTDVEIQDTMKLWGKQVGLDCIDCHVQDDFATDEKEEKKTARLMYQMVQALNQQEFFKAAGRTADCFLCHKGKKYIPAQ